MKKVILLLSFISITITAFGEKEAYFKQISTTDGSSISSAISICQDNLGNIWFGNDLLNKYDGNTIKKFRITDYSDIAQGTNIRKLQYDGDSLIYILSNSDLIIFDTYTWKFHLTPIQAGSIFYQNQKLYYTYSNELFSYNHSTRHSRKILETPYATETIKSVYFEQEDHIWLGTNKGLYLSKSNTIECIIDSIDISCFFIDSQKNLWIGTVDDGIRIVHTSDPHRISIIKENCSSFKNFQLSNNRIRCINEDNQQHIWIGTYTGITLFSLKDKTSSILVQNEKTDYSLKHNSIYAIYKDKQGTMWVGTYYGGISYFNPNIELYHYYPTDKSDPTMLNGLIIGNMTEDHKGNLYIASEEGGMNKFNKRTGEVARYNKEEGNLPDNTIKSVWYDQEKQKLFIGTFTQGLLVKKDGSDKFETVGKHLLLSPCQKNICDILPYKEYIIILTQENVYKLHRETHELTPLLPTPLLNYTENGVIHTLFLDNQNKLWVSSLTRGLYNINLLTSEITYFSHKTINPEGGRLTIKKIIPGNEGEIYLLGATEIIRYNEFEHSFQLINNDETSFFMDSYYNIARMNSGRFIITANNSISLFDPSEDKFFTFPFSKISPLKSINESSGLHISSLNEDIYIGGIGGMLVLSEEDLKTMSVSDNDSYELHFSSLSINNKPVNTLTKPEILKQDIAYSKLIELNYKQNNISISFASSDYMHADNIAYEYILENFDQQWTITKDKIIRYTSLPPGRYSLIVREVNNHSKTAKLSLLITPPFYASLFAYFVYGALAILLLFLILHFIKKNALLKATLQMEQREKQHLSELNLMKQNFFTNVSHEFRTPLTLIFSQIDVILKENNLQRSIKNKFLKIRKHTGEMQHLINELTHLTKLEQGNFPIKVSRQDISLFIKDIFIAFKEYALIRNITFKNECSEEPIEVWFDYVQLQKVLYNLLSNAFKFTPEGGCVMLSLKRKQDHIIISVEDNGIGIKEEDLNKVFEQFYQINRESTPQWMEGMGVGLSLSREIIRQHSGEISVKSEVGVMTCFTIKLLLGDAHFSEEQKGEWVTNENVYLPKPIISSKKEEQLPEQNEKQSDTTILIIEDNEGLLEILVEAFSPLYNIITANNGEDGLREAIESKPNLILTDVMIPRLSGLEVCKRLKAHTDTYHIPIILITAHSSLKQNIEGLQYGADDYIIKPFDIELLLLKCHNLIRNRKELQSRFQTQISDENTAKDDKLATNSIDRKFIEEAINIVESNICNSDFDTTVWARELKIGRSKLFQKIKEITGYTPNEYLLILKMKKATFLLKENTHLTVAEIAYQLGFSSPGYFSKCFKEQLGVTPIQYRNSQ
ncbi:ATP-binding protein [Bacteroides sp. 224]|uniref:ATP-binding protein n=1 Tax=Bacteroides sp. 224 TaxID=2302936 RepID=UPI0013D37D3E|nr:ATP-binding protein [Bacteroides sp. 224]NDV63796.1 response regulator [Bacteroides sp. 224]